MTEHRHLIYSLTKTFLAVLFCRLADRGELSLDDRLTTWIDDPRLPDATLREVLNHSAGIPDYSGRAYRAAVSERPGEPWSDDELLAHALSRPATSDWTYSNTGYLLLRRILDDLAPGGFAGALERELAAPLG